MWGPMWSSGSGACFEPHLCRAPLIESATTQSCSRCAARGGRSRPVKAGRRGSPRAAYGRSVVAHLGDARQRFAVACPVVVPRRGRVPCRPTGSGSTRPAASRSFFKRRCSPVVLQRMGQVHARAALFEHVGCPVPPVHRLHDHVGCSPASTRWFPESSQPARSKASKISLISVSCLVNGSPARLVVRAVAARWLVSCGVFGQLSCR